MAHSISDFRAMLNTKSQGGERGATLARRQHIALFTSSDEPWRMVDESQNGKNGDVIRPASVAQAYRKLFDKLERTDLSCDVLADGHVYIYSEARIAEAEAAEQS